MRQKPSTLKTGDACIDPAAEYAEIGEEKFWYALFLVIPLSDCI
jgi:hypothetical protein